MKSNRNLKKLVISCFAIFAVSCASKMQPLQQVQDQEKFLQDVVVNNPQIQTFKAKVRIEVKTKGKTYNFKSGIIMTNAAQLFMETYGLGIPQGYATLSNDKLTVIFPGEKEEYVGTGSSPLTKILKINVTMNELFDPILKKLVVSAEAPPTITMSSNQYVIKDAEKNEFFVNENKWIERIERRAGFLVEYGEPVSQKIKFPKSVRLSYEHQSIKLSFDDVRVNEPYEYSVFQLNIPTEGFHVYSIE